MATAIRRNRFNHLILVYLLLLLSNSTIFLIVQGRHVPLLPRKTTMMRREMKMRVLIGSRPPRCDKHKCVDCGGHCEAVQVPISPSTKKQQPLGYYKKQEILDYKPMSWKCRCGNFYLNPW